MYKTAYQENANGLKKSDIVLKNGTIVNVFTEELIQADVAICGDMIVGIGKYEGENEIDCTGKFIAPGLIDAHMHIESSMLTPQELSKVLVMAGTTTIVADPHEIVNVSGAEGLEYFLECRKEMLSNTFFMIPSSVPATDEDTNGAGEFLAKDMEPFVGREGVIGLGETMRFMDVCDGESRMSDKLKLFADKHIDGHAPGITGKSVQAYRLAGVENDHECAHREEMLEKMRAGFSILIREGSGAKNLEELVTTLLEEKLPMDQCGFCTDDKHVEEIIKDGHISTCVRKAIQLGVPTAKAYKMASIQTARMFDLKHIGAVAAGFKADLMIMDDVNDVRPSMMIKGGRLVVDTVLSNHAYIRPSAKLMDTVHFETITSDKLKLECCRGDKTGVIKMQPHQLLTTYEELEVPVESGAFRPDAKFNKICVVERHGKNGKICVAPILGFGIQHGAIATSVSHDSHNVIAAGDNDEDIVLAVNALKESKGGYVIASQGKVLQTLPLPISGLLSDLSYQELVSRLEDMMKTARRLGVQEDADPFITLSFMALTVIPEVRITERGLVRVI
ncbi:MAG: adenine deaminase [Lachnospira sp.]|nr:adenine deaminase [Lachnospira sp.]